MTPVNRLAVLVTFLSLSAWAQVDAGTVKAPAPKAPTRTAPAMKGLGSAKEDDEPDSRPGTKGSAGSTAGVGA